MVNDDSKHIYFTLNFHQNPKNPLQIQDSCVHTNQHCYINTPGLQHKKTQRFDIQRTTKVKLHTYIMVHFHFHNVYVSVRFMWDFQYMCI